MSKSAQDIKGRAYLPRASNFDDMEQRKKPSETYGDRWLGIETPCPLCKKHGGWNLRLDAYGEGKHFRATCFQCNGWGWVGSKDAECVHDFKEQPSQRMFHHVYKCTTCGRVRTTDSSG